MPTAPEDHGYRPKLWERVIELEQLSAKFNKNCREARIELRRQQRDLNGHSRMIDGSRSCIRSSRELLVEIDERLRIPKR